MVRIDRSVPAQNRSLIYTTARFAARLFDDHLYCAAVCLLSRGEIRKRWLARSSGSLSVLASTHGEYNRFACLSACSGATATCPWNDRDLAGCTQCLGPGERLAIVCIRQLLQLDDEVRKRPVFMQLRSMITARELNFSALPTQQDYPCYSTAMNMKTPVRVGILASMGVFLSAC